jgi:hypothetical protein
MPARIESDVISGIVDSFPGGGNWRVLNCYDLFERNGRLIDGILHEFEGVGGVYAILLPPDLFQRPLTIHLHGPNGTRIPFEFSISLPLQWNYAVVYVGRSSNLKQRWQAHFSKGDRIASAQVKYGLMDSGLFPDEEHALKFLRVYARIVYHELAGPDNCANRDVIEMTLLSLLRPPFNIKAEH